MQKELHCYSQPILDEIIDANFRERNLNESIKYVIGNIVNKIAIHKRIIQSKLENGEDPDTDMDGAWIDSNFYATVIGKDRYTQVMQKLVDINILTKELIPNEDNRLRPMPVYRIKNDLLMINGLWKKMFSIKAKTRIMKYWEWKLKEKIAIDKEAITKTDPPKTNIQHTKEHPVYESVMRQMAINCDKIDLTYVQVENILREKYYNSYCKKDHRIKEVMSVDKYIELNAPLCWNIIDRWNNATLLERCSYRIVDGFGFRLHHVFTYLPKEFRHHIKDPSGKLIKWTEMDVTGCQPMILSNRLVELDPTFRTDPFIMLVEEYKLYKNIATKLDINRDEAKVVLMRYMFCQRFQKDQDIFESFFPRVATFIKENWKVNDYYILKGKKNKRFCILAAEIQREETKMFRPVWQALLDNNQIFITCHDAVYVGNLSTEQVTYIHKLVIDILSQFIKIKFSVKVA